MKNGGKSQQNSKTAAAAALAIISFSILFYCFVKCKKHKTNVQQSEADAKLVSVNNTQRKTMRIQSKREGI